MCPQKQRKCQAKSIEEEKCCRTSITNAKEDRLAIRKLEELWEKNEWPWRIEHDAEVFAEGNQTQSHYEIITFGDDWADK